MGAELFPPIASVLTLAIWSMSGDKDNLVVTTTNGNRQQARSMMQYRDVVTTDTLLFSIMGKERHAVRKP